MKVFGAIVAVVVVLLWLGGSFDKALAPLGLNVHECATNGFGATFCGSDLDRYKRDVAEPIERWQTGASYESPWERTYNERYR